MEFLYTKHESDLGILHVPTLPIILNGFPLGNAIIDTGADVTLLPMELHKVLGVDLDYDNAIQIGSAGGGRFKAIPSAKKITYTIEHSGFRPITWKGKVFFSAEQPMILLGQYQCLSELKLTLDAPQRKITIH